MLFTRSLKIFGFFSNHEHFPGDHVVLYTAETAAAPQHRAQMEIAECGFFPADHLPEGTTGGTRRRIREVLEGLSPAATW